MTERIGRREIKRLLPPDGIGGGEEGVKRGLMAERRVFDALNFLQEQRRILYFRQSSLGSREDQQKKDFVILVERGKKYERFFLQVKSSERGRNRHREKMSKLRKQGIQAPEIPVVVVYNKDNIFSLLERIALILKLSK